MKKSYQIFRVAIFKDVSQDLILSYDLIFVIPIDLNLFSLLFLRDLTIIADFWFFSKI